MRGGGFIQNIVNGLNYHIKHFKVDLIGNVGHPVSLYGFTRNRVHVLTQLNAQIIEINVGSLLYRFHYFKNSRFRKSIRIP